MIEFTESRTCFQNQGLSKKITQCIKCGQNFDNYERPFSKCPHCTGICYECCIQQIDQCLNESLPISCPLSDCSAQMTIDNSIEGVFFRYLSYEKKRRIEEQLQKRLQNEKKLSKGIIQDQSWHCKNIDCNGEIHNGVCVKCGTLYCERCREEDHRGQCKAKSYKNIPQRTSRIIVVGVVKACPSCGQQNQKPSSKAQKVICINEECQTAFCWKHSKKWTRQHEMACNTHKAVCSSCTIY